MSNEKLYNQSFDGKVLLPFSLKIEPMQRLLLISFEKAKDPIYNCFEIQKFDNQETGTGYRIIAYRQDEYVDVYQEKHLSNNAAFDQCGKGLGEFFETSLVDTRFEITDSGLDVYFQFIDKMDRTVEVSIRERGKKKHPFELLAPLGEGAEKPSFLPVYLMFGFSFVRRNKTVFHIKINGKHVEPDNFPIPMDFSRCYFSRYSADPLLVNLNENFSGKIQPIPVDKTKRINYKQMAIDLEYHQEHCEIKEISRNTQNHSIKLSFKPAFPDIKALKDIKLNGYFEISSDESIGRIEGLYRVVKSNETVKIQISASGGWKPNEKRLFMKILYLIAPFFKRWPNAFVWQAEIDLKEADTYYLKGYWYKTKKQ